LSSLTKNMMNNPHLYSRLFLLSTLILLLNACRKTEGTDTADYVVKEVYAYGELTASHEYNDAWQRIKSSYTERISSRAKYNRFVSYFYNIDGRLARVETTSDGPLQAFTVEYTYNNQGRLTMVKALRKNGELLYQEEYGYNGKTITNTHSISTGVDYVTTYTVDDRGNIVKAVKDDQTSGNNDYTEEWQDFDDKINMSGPGVGDVSSKNNPRRHILYYVRQQSPSETIMTYKYNGAGYVVIRKDAGQTLTTNYVLIARH
jgi:hypothetical protein